MAVREGISKHVLFGADPNRYQVNVLSKAEGEDLSEQCLSHWVADRTLPQAVLDVLVIHVENCQRASSTASTSRKWMFLRQWW